MRRHVAQIALARYGLAVLAVAATVAFALWLRPVTLVAGQLSLVAILTVGWICGLPPALVAWGLATLAFAYYFTPPLDSLAVDRVELPRLIIFALLGLLMATVSAARRRAQESLRRIRAELEARVRERTADLERSNEQLQAALAERQGHVWLLESIDRIHRVTRTTNDLEQMMSDVLDAALSIFDCDRAWLMHPCDPEAVSHEVKMQRTRSEFPSLLDVGDEVPIDPETADMFRTVRASSGPVQFGPDSAHPLSSELAQRRRVQSRIVMALYPKGELPYIFGASQCSYARLWTPREELLFQKIGRRLEDALTSLSIFHRLRESEKRYRHIFESSGVSIDVRQAGPTAGSHTPRESARRRRSKEADPSCRWDAPKQDTDSRAYMSRSQHFTKLRATSRARDVSREPKSAGVRVWTNPSRLGTLPVGDASTLSAAGGGRGGRWDVHRIRGDALFAAWTVRL
jgi:hypothetical protein